MDKIDIVGLASEKEAVISALMNLGAVEISDETNIVSIETDIKNTVPIESNSSQELLKLKDLMSLMKSAIETSDKYHQEKKPVFSQKRKIFETKYNETVKMIEVISEDAGRIQDSKLQISNLRTKIAKNKLICDRYKDWINVDIKLENLHTKYTKVWLGSVPGISSANIISELLNVEVPESAINVIKENEDSVQVAVIVWEEKEELAARVLKESEFVPLHVAEAVGTPADNYKFALEQIKSANLGIELLEKEIFDLSKDPARFEVIHDHAMIQMDKVLSSDLLSDTKYTFILKGWAPSHLTESIHKALRSEYNIAFKSRKATKQDEYPLLLKNHPLVKPYEVVTNMFSTPSVRDIDPNPIMAPFFLFFFSMMLSDAGYGLLLAAGCALMIWKFKVTGNMRNMCLFLFHGGLASVVWGLLFGGFFGDLISIASSGNISFPTIWFNPIEDPTKLMIWSMIFGVIHILAGLSAKAFILIMTGKLMDAVFDIFSWFFVIIGAGVMLYGMAGNLTVVGDIGKYMALSGLGIIILFGGRGSRNPIVRLFKGIGGLYNITGYFSDILSYTRIVALSLATAVIAMVVNMLGSIAGFSLIGIIMFIIVVIAGHLLNLAISALGCYVHTSRLQYVEFFSKFYEGGGRAWNPVTVNTRYIKLVSG